MDRLLPFAFSFAVSTVACGGNVSTDPSTTQPAAEDSGAAAETEPADTGVAETEPPHDHGAPSTTYPAFKPDMPQIVDMGSGPLKAPVLTTVTFAGDPNADSYEAFGDKLGGTAYWTSIVAEYGVGPATSDAAHHVRETFVPPATWHDTEIDAWISDHVENYAKYGWPAGTDQSIYVVYIPQKTSVSMADGTGGEEDACSSGVGGYHTSTTADHREIAYAVVMQCAYGSTSTRPRTVSSSHEIGEATLDPFPQTGSPGYAALDKDHAVWTLFMNRNIENADMCEIYRESRYQDMTDPGFAFSVQRQWSNASANAGHNPCVPAPTSAPYFNVAALDPEKTTFNGSSLGLSSKMATLGYHVAVGETKSFAVGIYSDGPTDDITLKAGEGTALATMATAKHLTISLDKTSGKNGEKAWVTVTVNSVDSKKASVLVISSSDGSTTHYKPILISSQ